MAANYRKPAVVTLSLGIQASKHAPEAEAEAELSCLRAPRQQSSSSADWPLLLSPLPLPAGGQLVAGAGGRRPLAHHQAGHHGALRLLRLLCLLLHAAAPCMRRASLCPLTSLASSSPPPSLPRWWWPAATAASTPATWRRVRAVSSELAAEQAAAAGARPPPSNFPPSPAAVQLPTPLDPSFTAPSTAAANVPEVITVAASNLATKYNGSRAGDAEDIYRWSNTGPCLVSAAWLRVHARSSCPALPPRR